MSAIVIWFASGINFYDSMPSNIKYVFCFLPNPALTFAIQIILQFEKSGRLIYFYFYVANKFYDFEN